MNLIEILKKETEDMSEKETIARAMKIVHNLITYTDDAVVYSKPEYWGTYEEIKRYLTDDCDGYAVYLFHVVTRDLKIDKSKFRLVVLNDRHMWHMACLYFKKEDEIYIIDPTWNRIIEIDNPKNTWTPIASFDLENEWIHGDYE